MEPVTQSAERAGRPLRLDAMATLWSPAHKVVLERQLWLAVLRAQAELGVDVPAGAIEAYQRVVDQGTDRRRSRLDRRARAASPGTT